MSDAVFVDTSGWASYFDGDDPRHAVVAASVVDALRQQHILVTTNYIITETLLLRLWPFFRVAICAPHTQSWSQP